MNQVCTDQLALELQDLLVNVLHQTEALPLLLFSVYKEMEKDHDVWYLVVSVRRQHFSLEKKFGDVNKKSFKILLERGQFFSPSIRSPCLFDVPSSSNLYRDPR